MDDNTNTHSDQEECRDYKRNVCTKGSACKYYHPPKDVSAIFERNSVCHDYQNQKGCHRDSCKFLHLTREEEAFIKTNGSCPPSLSQEEMDKIIGLPPLCNDYLRGTCTRGKKCKFRHVGEPGVESQGGRAPFRGVNHGADRFVPYGRPADEDPYERMERRRRYREDMMEDEIMYLRAQVGRLKRQVADLAATNESLMTENARLRVDRNRAAGGINPLPAITGRTSEFSITPSRSAYPYTSGLKLEPSTTPLPTASTLAYSSSELLF